MFAIRFLLISSWSKEIPEQWNFSKIIPVHNKRKLRITDRLQICVVPQKCVYHAYRLSPSNQVTHTIFEKGSYFFNFSSPFLHYLSPYWNPSAYSLGLANRQAQLCKVRYKKIEK